MNILLDAMFATSTQPIQYYKPNVTTEEKTTVTIHHLKTYWLIWLHVSTNRICHLYSGIHHLLGDSKHL